MDKCYYKMGKGEVKQKLDWILKECKGHRLRAEDKINSTKWRRIWIRLQGAAMAPAYCMCPLLQQAKTDSKTSPARAAVEFIFSSALTCWEAVGLCGYRYFA
jgi:hypothetical protein